MKIIGINNLVDKTFDEVLTKRGVAHSVIELGVVGACHVSVYDYMGRIAYERTGMIDVDCSASKVVVCDGRLDDESAAAVNTFVENA